MMRLLGQRRFMRYSLLSLNALLLGSIVWFVLRSSPSVTTNNLNSSTANSSVARDPLDQVSTADIAVNLALMTGLAETPAVTNQADSASALMLVPAQTTVIAKPQTVATELKSSKDIITYTVKEGDTVASIAAKFNVTSESIQWSNNLGGNVVSVGAKLVIPPVTGIVYTVKAGDTPDTLAQKFRASRDQIVAYNDAEISGLKVGQQVIIPNGQQVVVRSSYYGNSDIFTAMYGSNGYDRGFCTWWVAKRRADIGRPVPSNLGDAYTWDNNAIRAGITVNNIPAEGAAIVTSTNAGPGHVAFVEKINEDGSIWISEMNSSGFKAMDVNSPRTGGWGIVDYKLIDASAVRGYNYIH